MKKQITVIFYLLLSTSLFASEFEPLRFADDAPDYFVRSNNLKYFVDSGVPLLNKNSVYSKLNDFKTSQNRNLLNLNTEKTYWLFFKVINTVADENNVIELYDFNIDKVSIFLFKNKKLQLENHAGYLSNFNDRILHHKNFSYPFNLAQHDTLEVFMRLKSDKKSLLNPVIKTRIKHTKYTLKEYLLLGLFYGVFFLVTIYNLIYFFILREKTYLIYVFYLIFISFYFLSQDGVGFQYLWPQFAFLNKYIENASLCLSIISLLFFSASFIKPNRIKTTALYLLMASVLVVFLVDLFLIKLSIFRVLLFVCFQVCLFLGITDNKKNQSKNRWYNLSFVLMNTFYLIQLLENLDLIPSGAFTVYAMNFGIILQFISLSIGITENSKSAIIEKNRVLGELLNTKKENDSLRLVELKRQMNPHFLFNALNSIQSRILVNNNEDASTLLLKFSQLLRKNLEISDVQFITFKEEIELIKNYLEIEKIRLGGSFCFEIKIDPNIEIEAELIPTFLIQPLVENAIWHGFSKKEDNQFISIEFKLENKAINILVHDNGSGISNSEKKDNNNPSKGLSIVNERLELIEKTFGKKIELTLISPYRTGETGTLAKMTLWK